MSWNDSRGAAASILGQVLTGRSLAQALPQMLDKVSPRDQSLVQQLCYGTLRDAPRLEAILSQLLEKPLRNKDRDIYALLMLGIYQLDALRVPDHAAVAATVAATEALNKGWAKGLTNAILRRYIRDREGLEEHLNAAQAHAHPAWLYGKILKQWPDAAAAIFAANNAAPPMSLRVNTRRITRADYLSMLTEAGIFAVASDLSPVGVRLSQPIDVLALPGFSDGLVSVQDEAAQMAAAVLASAPGERILDACAAPGGKTCHILELQPALTELVAADVDPARLAKVEENLTRLELSAVLCSLDARAPTEALHNTMFDRILVDAPCSASGVLRRNPDVKLLRQPEDIAQLAQQQLAILTGLWPHLKSGGLLVYATCSILNEENSAVITAFLQQQTDARLALPDVTWGEEKTCGRQILPAQDGPDGLFYSRLSKTV